MFIIKSLYSLWSIGRPWRASMHCDLQLSLWPRSTIFLFLLFHPLLSFATFSSAYLFFHIPNDFNLTRFSLLLLLLCVMCPIQFHFLLLIWITMCDIPSPKWHVIVLLGGNRRYAGCWALSENSSCPEVAWISESGPSSWYTEEPVSQTYAHSWNAYWVSGGRAVAGVCVLCLLLKSAEVQYKIHCPSFTKSSVITLDVLYFIWKLTCGENQAIDSANLAATFHFCCVCWAR